jgi:hypothetical protein
MVKSCTSKNIVNIGDVTMILIEKFPHKTETYSRIQLGSYSIWKLSGLIYFVVYDVIKLVWNCYKHQNDQQHLRILVCDNAFLGTWLLTFCRNYLLHLYLKNIVHWNVRWTSSNMTDVYSKHHSTVTSEHQFEFWNSHIYGFCKIMHWCTSHW